MNLTGATSIAQLQARLSAHATLFPSLAWIIGYGWEQDTMERYPCASDLEELAGCAERPIFLWRACWHIALVNTVALQIAGITAASLPALTHQLSGGVIDHNPLTGSPTGILREAVGTERRQE